MRASPLLLSAFLAAASSALADYVVDENLGVLQIGDTPLVGTTAGGNNNSIFPKFIFTQGDQLNFGTEYVYQFELQQPSILTITSHALTNDPDFFLLNGLVTTLDFQSGKIGADNALEAALLNDPQPKTYVFNALLPGTYYIAVENYDGPDGFVVPRDADFDITLNLEEAIAIDFPLDLGLVAKSGTPLTFDTFGTLFDTELAIYDFNGVLVAENDDEPGGGLESELSLPNGLPQGTYYAVLAGHETTFGPDFALSAGGATGNWRFNFPLGPTFGPGEETGTTDSAFVATEAQWFIFDIVDPPSAPIALGILAGPGEQFVIDTEGSGFDTQLALYDSEGFRIDFNDDIDFLGGNLASQFDFLFGLSEGLYYLVLAGYPNVYADAFFVFVDDEISLTSEGGDYVLNHPDGPTFGSIAVSARQWFTFRVTRLDIDITDVDYNPATKEFTVAWTSNVPGPFNIVAGTGADLAALQAPPNHVLPTLVAVGATSPATFGLPAALQGDKVFFQVTD